jgi:hypothetical protein
MIGSRLYKHEEITGKLVRGILYDYEHKLPSFDTMAEELQGYDLVELTVLLTNMDTIYLVVSANVLELDMVDIIWIKMFCSGYKHVLRYMIERTNLVCT